MTEQIVVSIDEELIQELKLRAARNGRSMEEEHRQILRRALRSDHGESSLKQILSEMPDVGDDEDFERVQDFGRPVAL